MKYLVVIPARGGSKGILNKNIYPVCGKPLLEYSIETALEAHINGDITVSSDSVEILKIASKYDRVICIQRPDSISGDRASTETALLHALEYMRENFGREYDAVVTMQPTSPLRRAETVRKFLKQFEDNIPNFDAQISLAEDRRDFWTLTDEGAFERLFPEAPRRRQERKPLYTENGCIYVTKTESLADTNSVLGKRVNGYVIPALEGIDINEPPDIVIAETYLKTL